MIFNGHFDTFTWNFFYELTFKPEASRIFFVVKITLGLAKSSIIDIPEVMVLMKSFISSADEIGKGTHFSSDMTIVSMI